MQPLQQRVVQVVPTAQIAHPILNQIPKSNNMNVQNAPNTQRETADNNFYFYLNEKKITLDSVDPTMTLNDFIRGQRK